MSALAHAARVTRITRGRRRRLVPYMLMAPGLAWLIVFFLVPMYYLGQTSLQKGSLELGYTFSWAWSNYGNAISTYHT